MSNVACHISPGQSHFRGMEKYENICPNCKTTLGSCKPRTSCLVNPPTAPCQNCQRCLMAATPCIAGGLVPYFPLPYVCRHWLSVSSTMGNSTQPTCFHNHSCVQPLVNESTMSRPVSQIEVTPTNPFILAGGAVQRLDIDTTFKDRMHPSSRSNSPESNIIIPDIIFSFNGVPVAKILQPWTVDDDQAVLSNTKEDLEKCGWFYGNLTWQEAAAMLTNSSRGTFLIRNSSSVKCPYALSVQTSQGPTSIRIEYEKGQFWLDCERKGVTPQFDNIMKLISYYQDLASSSERQTIDAKSQEITTGKNVWVDHRGRVYSPISITKPLLRSAPSLKHICRVTINSKTSAVLLANELPSSLILYLSKYPYRL